MKMKRVFGLMTAAGCALCAVSAMGAASTVVTENFEGVVAPAELSALGNTWSGYGSVTAATYTAAYADAGSPISGTHAQVLAVEGRVTRTAATTQSNATVDMMVQIATPDDALAFPSGTDTAGIQIAVGVETNATLKVYCKNKSSEPGWYPLGSTPLAVGSWHRVSFTFDYANKTCQVLVDGSPAVSATGYLTATATSADGNGSWYKLAKADASALASVQVIGSTSIDDLLVQESATATEVEPAVAGSTTGGGATVPNSWFVEQGVAREDVAAPAPDNSGMTVAQKYVTGLSATDGQVFAITDMTMSENKVTLTVPVATANVGHNTIQYSTDQSSWTDAVTDASGTVEVDVNPGNAGTPPAVIYVRLINK